jgi:hypothetical protein
MSSELRLRTVALKGDVILCPACRLDIARFKGNRGFNLELLPDGLRKVLKGSRCTLHCRTCGKGAFEVAAHGAGTRAIEAATGPRALIRSGSWVGWRAFGGE